LKYCTARSCFSAAARGERAEIAPPAGLRILLAGIEPVLAGSKLADHGVFIVQGYRLNK
jgi:hypothetical protein